MSSAGAGGLITETAIEEYAMTTIYAQEVRSGDVVDYGGTLHRVTNVERRRGWAWSIAFDDEGWAMALGDQLVQVDRAAA